MCVILYETIVYNTPQALSCYLLNKKLVANISKIPTMYPYFYNTSIESDYANNVETLHKMLSNQNSHAVVNQTAT